MVCDQAESKLSDSAAKGLENMAWTANISSLAAAEQRGSECKRSQEALRELQSEFDANLQQQQCLLTSLALKDEQVCHEFSSFHSCILTKM